MTNGTEFTLTLTPAEHAVLTEQLERPAHAQPRLTDLLLRVSRFDPCEDCTGDCGVCPKGRE